MDDVSQMKMNGIRDATLTLYEDTLYTEKALFWLATQWRRAHYLLGIPSILCSAAAGVSLIKSDPFLAGVLTSIAALLTALITFLDPKTFHTRYHDCGIEYATLRGKLERFKSIDLAGEFDEPRVRKQLESFAAEKAALQKKAPHTGGIAYFFARKSIAKGEHKPD
jgi:hypothetical protein